MNYMLVDAIAHLNAAKVGACTCRTKSPKWFLHQNDCRYRRIVLALDLIKLAQSDTGEYPKTTHKEKKA